MHTQKNAALNVAVLCRVIDNFGDIGVAYRLCRSLLELAVDDVGTSANGAKIDGVANCAGQKLPNVKLFLIVDDLNAFALIVPGIKTSTFMQGYCGITVCYSPLWDKVDDVDTGANGAQIDCVADGAGGAQVDGAQNASDWSAHFAEYFAKQKIDVIIECFACGRPFWLENLIFAPQNNLSQNHFAGQNLQSAEMPLLGKNLQSAQTALITQNLQDAQNVPQQKNHSCTIFNVEYLTAEDYAEEFHLQRALTRASCVKKYFFMPGLSAKTGGLILDKAFMSALATCKKNNSILFFAYKKNFAPIISALNKSLCAQTANGAPGVTVADGVQFTHGAQVAQGTKVLVAKGVSQAPFLDACKKYNAKFCLESLPFLHQQEWDAMLCTCNFLFVRGEDSLSRALLLGVPFVWHAYPQSQEHQLVKVESFLNFLKPYFTDAHFNLIADVWRLYNKDALLPKEADELCEKLCLMIKMRDDLEPSFKKSAKEIAKNGNLALQLMTFIAKIV